ncbi:MAG: hypothetical protein KDK51_09225 [Deltaproteobacteria bacterium]|nr:hypothetical protein [Deltaproteobacteria bacterium]
MRSKFFYITIIIFSCFIPKVQAQSTGSWFHTHKEQLGREVLLRVLSDDGIHYRAQFYQLDESRNWQPTFFVSGVRNKNSSKLDVYGHMSTASISAFNDFQEEISKQIKAKQWSIVFHEGQMNIENLQDVP